MTFPLRIFPSGSSLRPGLACEVTSEGVIAARQTGGEQAILAFAPLHEGVVQPGVVAPNFAEPALITMALRKALDEVAARDTELTLVIPDAAVRVLILDFDSLPAKTKEALPIVRFRLRKLTPFDVDDAAVSYQSMSPQQGQTRILATVMPAAIRAEYEGMVRAAGYEPGVLLPSTLAALATLPPGDAALVVNRNGRSLTTAITTGGELLLHRILELPVEEDSRREDLAQAVSEAAAYFEDMLHAVPRVLYYVGPGGAEDFARQLGTEPNGMVRDLVPTPATGVVSAIPKGLTAGVMGALAS